MRSSLLSFLLLTLINLQLAHAVDGVEIQQRILEDIDSGLPLVVHVVVALCDNKHQGIVKVPAFLGDGQNPKTNLYWGARYGVKTYFNLSKSWKLLASPKTSNPKVLDKVIFSRIIRRNNKNATVYLVAEAWDGEYIADTIDRFLTLSAGYHTEAHSVGADLTKIKAGGSSHVVAFVGHNGLMDFPLDHIPKRSKDSMPNSSIILACASKEYFSPLFADTGSYPLLLTTGLMAPEAYTLEAAIASWFAKGTSAAVHQAAASAYDKYQNCGLRAAKRLFAVGD